MLSGAIAVEGTMSSRTSLTVMTRNLYLGTDVNRAVVAAMAAQAEGRTPQEIVVALANALHTCRAIVDRTDFRVRARLLAHEIVRTEPDLVGLQEVALWRSGELQLDGIGALNATQVDDDFLQILLDELTARGSSYTAVSVGIRADVEGPSFTGSPFDGTIGDDARDIRLTMRDVILVRVEDHLAVTGTDDRIYSHNLTVPLLGATVRFDRGYQWADLRHGTGSIRFVNTHLEAYSSDIALAQASELVDDVTAPDRPTVIACDINSDPRDSSTGPLDEVPRNAPYDLITGPGGFTDEWLGWAPPEEGWTSGLSETVDEPTTAGFDHRIDMVFGRTPGGAGLEVERGEVTGTDLADRDPDTGLWPSDHGGVVLTLRL
jgi:endonuclease/exonuclease/phosphatase family metal-dependent hydrolase